MIVGRVASVVRCVRVCRRFLMALGVLVGYLVVWVGDYFADVSLMDLVFVFFFFSSRRRHTSLVSDWSSDMCSSDLSWGTRPRRAWAPAWCFCSSGSGSRA